MSSTPGRELAKEWREIADRLVREQGWRYEHGRKHATLYPADKSRRPIVFSVTPSDHRAFKNWIALIRRSGGDI
jgi:hypothetical protein